MHRKFNFNIVLYIVYGGAFFRHLFTFIGVLCTHKCIVLWCIIPMAIKQTVSFRSFSRFVIQCCENHLKFHTLVFVSVRHNTGVLSYCSAFCSSIFWLNTLFCHILNAIDAHYAHARTLLITKWTKEQTTERTTARMCFTLFAFVLSIWCK